MVNKSRQSGVVLEKNYQFLLWLIPALDKFPRSQKFLLGDRIQSTALDVQEALIAATYSDKSTHHLYAANLHLERLRMLVSPVGCGDEGTASFAYQMMRFAGSPHPTVLLR